MDHGFSDFHTGDIFKFFLTRFNTIFTEEAILYLKAKKRNPLRESLLKKP